MGPLTTPHTPIQREHRMPSYETDQPIVLSIELSQGMVHVIATDRTDTVVSVSPTDRARPADVEESEKTIIDMANGTLSIKSPRSRGIARHVLGWGRSGSIDVTVELPEGSSLRADTGVADFRCDGRLDSVDVNTGVGDIQLDQTGMLHVHSGVGRFTLEMASGDAEIVAAGNMTIGTVTGDADVKNNNGATSISRVGGDASVRSANGDVTIEDASHDVTVKTANGDITLGHITRGTTIVETGFGGLEVGIGEGTAAWIDANTKFGHIHNILSPADQPDQTAETVQVRARTAFGDVVITRS